ncbi:hypothetical protein MKX01_013534 [Papaver californicum]|nr:hypothetical protein MKX01_013534 [Papaver californicum]
MGTTNPMLNGTDDVDNEAKLSKLPSGFRFQPTDEQLIVYYLVPKVLREDLPANRMKEVENLYHYHPKKLIQQYKGYESNDWYFFTRKYQGEDHKDVGGEDTNFIDNKFRVAGQGFWLLTTHSSIYSTDSSNSVIGYKDAWVYYEGRDSEEYETDYVMQEYTMATPSGWNHSELDHEWILCGIYKNEQRSSKPFERSTSIGSNSSVDSIDSYSSMEDEETQFYNVEKDVETKSSDDDEFDC